MKHAVTGPDPEADYTGTGTPPSRSPISGADSSLDKPPAPPTRTVMQPTKFAKLLKFAAPLVQGAAVGGFGGNWRVPGSGFQASEQMFGRQREFALQQNELALRRQLLQRQIYDDQYRNALEAARTREVEAQGRRYDELVTASNKTKPQIIDTEAGLMRVEPDSGEMTPVRNMAPEETGSLPFPGESSTAPLHRTAPERATAPERPVVVGEGQEAVDPKTGRVIVPPRPKTFAPRQPKQPRAVDVKSERDRNVETYAGALLKQFGNDAQKALDAVEGLKSLDPGMKSAVRNRIREMQRPATTRRRTPISEDRMRQLATAPPG